jgi:hypothetical protein
LNLRPSAGAAQRGVAATSRKVLDNHALDNHELDKYLKLCCLSSDFCLSFRQTTS